MSHIADIKFSSLPIEFDAPTRKKSRSNSWSDVLVSNRLVYLREYSQRSFSKIDSLAEEGSEEQETIYTIPERRIPPISWSDTVIFDKNGKMVSVHGTVEFISDLQIVYRHPMKFISYDTFSEADRVIGVTKEGKHVLLQQGTRACVPAAISMLALDLGRKPLFKEMKRSNITSFEMEKFFLEKAELQFTVHELNGAPIEKVTYLKKLLQLGPGILSLENREIGGHVVILDTINFKKMSATIRDPYHGWQIDVHLVPFMQFIGSRFIAVK